MWTGQWDFKHVKSNRYLKILHFLKYIIVSFLFPRVIAGLIDLIISGDMEMKQNQTLPVEKQIVTANPDIHTVSKFNGLRIHRNI